MGMLSADQARDFLENGYLLAPGFLDSAYCAHVAQAITNEYNQLVESGWKFCAGGRYTGHLNFKSGRYGREIFEMLQQSGLIAAAEAIMGSRLDLFNMGGNMNLPGSVRQDIHQDFAPPSESFVFNVSLVPARSENGATEIVPLSHGARYTYRTLHSTAAIQQCRPIESNPGDLTMRFGTLWHRGMPNRSEQPRPMLCFTMVPTDKKEPTVPDGDPVRFYANRFYGPQAAVRELAEIHLAKAFHVLRMARS